MDQALDGSPSEQLALQTRRIDLMLAIDRLRDEAEDERELVTAAVSMISNAIEVDLCLLSLIDPDTKRLEVRAVLDRLGRLDELAEDQLHELAHQASLLSEAQVLKSIEATGLPDSLHWLASPLRVHTELLGALLLARQERTFNSGDRALLLAAVSQLDSAIKHARTLHELRRERLELRTIYTIDRIRDRGLSFDDMLNAVLIELCRTVPSEAGFIMLFDVAGHQLELKAATDHNLLDAADHYQLVYSAAAEAVRQAQPIARSAAAGQIRSLICVPLILNEHIIGVLGVINRHGRVEFTRADRHLLWAIASQIDTAIFEGLQIQKYREVFGRRVGPQVMERLLSTSDRDLLKGERAITTTLFSDIRGFTYVSEGLEPELLVRMLNEHLSTMTEIVLSHEGLVDKFVGDCVMALYNAPERQPDHALRAVKTALAMMAAHQQLMQHWAPHLPAIGIGIATGETIVGNFGSTQRNEYTAISRHVNLASRLCGIAEADQILISAATYDLVQAAIEAKPIPALKLKGIPEAVDAYQVLGLK
jgi:class 3 adenylate cyclase/GAF domain-containing protein